jgi:hypothetical protein
MAIFGPSGCAQRDELDDEVAIRIEAGDRRRAFVWCRLVARSMQLRRCALASLADQVNRKAT